MQNALLYGLTTLIWGSTWIAITFQLGRVAPEASVAYRFGLATLLLLAYTGARRLPMRFLPRQHVWIALQGVFLFSFNYILVYLAEQHLNSGLVAIAFSTVSLMNVVLGAIFLGNPIRPRVLGGGLLGVAGLALVFSRSLADFELSGGGGLGLALSLVGVLSASIGMILAARNQRAGLPIVQTNAFGMAYGALCTLAVGVLRGVAFTFDSSAPYVLSLGYLSLFGTVIAFGAYLTLVGRMGVDRASYIAVVFPLVALALSTLLEGLSWNLLGLVGVACVVAGNLLVISRPQRRDLSGAGLAQAPSEG